MDIKSIVDTSMVLIKSGKVRNHAIKETARDHNTNVLLIERQQFEDFIVSKNGYMVMNLLN